MADALFLPDGDLFVPTELTRGGWSDDAQHGAPPSGLLARAIERVPTAVPMQVVRFTIDLFRPVPLTPLAVTTTVRRDGRRIQVVDAYLFAGEVEVGRASALKIRVLDHLELGVRDTEAWEQPPGPEEGDPVEWGTFFVEDPDTVRFHSHAIEIRSIDGNSQALDPRRYLYVNPDITLYAHRLPVGEWLGMRSAAHQHPSGIGLADTRVFDREGPLGRINQAQLLDLR